MELGGPSWGREFQGHSSSLYQFRAMRLMLRVEGFGATLPESLVQPVNGSAAHKMRQAQALAF